MDKKIKIQMEARSSYFCFGVANACYEFANRSTEDCEIQHHCVTGIVFTAFSVEAMLNHFGTVLIKDWNKIERNCKYRKDAHRKIFKAANLPEYLGTKTYQIIEECFNIRDQFAHGKTTNNSHVITVSSELTKEEIFHKALSVPIESVRMATIEKLRQFIDTAKDIEKDIQDNSFYPNQEHIPIEKREKLIECSLSFTGVRSW